LFYQFILLIRALSDNKYSLSSPWLTYKMLFLTSLATTNHWINMPKPTNSMHVGCKFRYRQQDNFVTLKFIDDDIVIRALSDNKYSLSSPWLTYKMLFLTSLATTNHDFVSIPLIL